MIKLENLVLERKNLPIDFCRAEVFSGGGCKGFYYTGYIKAKEGLGLTDIDIGTKSQKFGVSIGSLLSAINSIGWPSSEIGKYVMGHPHVMKHLFNSFNFHPFSRDDPEHKEILPSTLDGKPFSNSSFVSTRPLEHIVDYFVGDLMFKDLKDLTIVACEYASGNPVFFNYKNFPDVKVSKAILASAAVPGVFPMVELEMNGDIKYLIDGGGDMNLPIETSLIDRKTKNIVAIDLINTSEHNRAPMPKNALDTYLNAGFIGSSKKIKDLFKYVLHRNYEQSVEDKIFRAEIHDELRGNEVHFKHFPNKKNILFINPKINPEYFVKTDMEHLNHLEKQGYEECKPLLERFEKFKK